MTSHPETITTIPLVDMRAAHAEVAAEIQAGFDDVLASTAFIKGAAVEAFERDYAAFTGVTHCVGVANGTDAVELALRAAGVTAGAEVIMPANTFVATAEAVVRAGARPAFADVDPDYLLLDPRTLEAALSPDTAAVLPVHLFGQLAPMAAIAEVAGRPGTVIIEDAAQAHGATQDGRPAGSFGLLAGVSFYPGKNLGAYGDAGAVLTESAEHARHVRLLGDHGSERRYEHVIIGFNSRLDAFQAVVLRARLRRLAAGNEARRQAAGRYSELLADVPGVTLPMTAPGNEHVWHLYVIRVPRRDHVLQCLHDEGIQAGIHYPVPVHLQPAFRQLGYGPGDFPVAEAAAGQLLSLPLYPQLTEEQQLRVVDAVRRALR
ncbi:MAG: DegT/DnrJ/EryC1/StrS family aminotransferase [Streptosporangiaceae bacterium]